ncbi:MAG: glycosyltransferase family 39 protein [Acidobacteria bacterium]|nr:glycosyltransferase family 39 protein [Acidobacteriota bacterium]
MSTFRRERGPLLIVVAAVLLIRLPFLRQAVQGDDVYYIAIARNALVDPLHPMQMGYTFQGRRVEMSGHPHPPLNAYILAALLRIFGHVRELPFHLFYMLFSLLAAAAMYCLAGRFTDHPLLATLLFVCVPAFVVNGNSLEADLPFLAFWMLSFALYFEGHHLLSAGSLAVAALGAYQAIFAVPILAHEVWHSRRHSRTAWIPVLAAPLALAAWQGWQRISTGEVPATVLAGYFQTYGLLALVKKFHSALALTDHLGWMVFPIAILATRAGFWIGAPVALVVTAALSGYFWWQRLLLAVSLVAGLMLLARWAVTLWKARTTEDGFLATWGLVFFAGAVAVFYAGSARYLLPMAAPLILTLVRGSPRTGLLWGAAACSLVLGLAMASANYQYCDHYRRFAGDLRPRIGERRLWSNAEWGLRYYLEEMGGEPLENEQAVYAGSVVVTSELAGPIPFFIGGGSLQEVRRADFRSRIPIRLIGLGTRSGYSSSALGVLPFDPDRGLLDRVKAEIVGLAEPGLSYLRMGDPEAASQLLSGFYQIENNAWRWMAEQAVVLLKAPDHADRFEMTFFIPDQASARRVTLALDGLLIAAQTYPAPGGYTLSVPVRVTTGSTPQLTITVDKTFQPSNDQRRLGMVVEELGFKIGRTSGESP